jgi:hypothetical protein
MLMAMECGVVTSVATHGSTIFALTGKFGDDTDSKCVVLT